MPPCGACGVMLPLASLVSTLPVVAPGTIIGGLPDRVTGPDRMPPVSSR